MDPEVQIGEADGAAEYALGGVVGAVRLTDGRIVIANFNTFNLRYYDSLRRHVRSVGRKGDGPGEFRLIRGIGRTGDTILVWDPFANRVSRFDGTGTFATSVNLNRRDMRVPALTGFMEDGSMLLRVRSNTSDKQPEGEYIDSVTFLRFSSTTGNPINTLGPHFGAEAFIAEVGHNRMGEFVIFGRRSFVAGARAGFHMAISDRFEATFFAADGTPLRTVRRPHTPARASTADLAAARKVLEREDEEILRMDPDLGAVQRRLLDNLPHRSTLPAISQLRVDREDNLWIRAYVPPDAEMAEWSIFDPEGHWLGVIQIPAELEVLEIGDDYLLAKTVDPLDDVERVVLHRLRKPR